MEYSISQHKRCSVIKISGRIDGSNSPQLESAIKEITDTGNSNIVVDMSDVDFMSSAGWWVLIETQKACKKNGSGEAVLVGVKEKIRSSLSLVGMDEYFRMFDQVTEAVGSF